MKRSGLISATAALSVLAAACGSTTGGTAPTGGKAPAQITVGTLYSSSGSFATSSMPEYAGLKFWVKQENAKGGAYVGAFHKRIPLKLVALNDQSNPETAATLYSQLITQDKVNILVADFGSVLTAPAVTIAQEHHQLLFDVSGSGTTFFSASNPYVVLTSLPTSGVWPTPLVKFLVSKKIKRVAMIYDSNDFDASQAATIRKGLAAQHITPVFDQAVPTSTTSYTTLINNIAATNPQAVLELGYPNNDIAFLQALGSMGRHFPLTFTAFPGQLHALLESNVGAANLSYVYSYGFPPQLAYNSPNAGLGTAAFVKQFGATTTGPVNFLDIAGYNAGVVVGAALRHATSLSQLSLKQALVSQSGKLQTIEGSFKIQSDGAQIGERLPVSQMFPSSNGTTIKLVYPSSSANASARYPAP